MVQSVERPVEPRPAPVREPLAMKSLLEAGVHFGHQTRRWNPRMKRYIFTQRNGIHIIDLQQTLGMINDAYRAMTQVAAGGGKVLFVGTKRQAQEVIASEAERCGMWYVNQRWLGGTLTNFQTIHSRINHMIELQQKRDQGYFRQLPKKEAVRLRDKLSKLEKYFHGLRAMNEVPAALFVIDIGKEDICIAEAQRMGVQIFAIVDTDCDPEKVSHAIPGNDDAVRSIRLITARMATAILEGQAEREAMLESQREELSLAGAVALDDPDLDEEPTTVSIEELEQEFLAAAEDASSSQGVATEADRIADAEELGQGMRESSGAGVEPVAENTVPRQATAPEAQPQPGSAEDEEGY